MRTDGNSGFSTERLRSVWMAWQWKDPGTEATSSIRQVLPPPDKLELSNHDHPTALKGQS
jgi:hypothetical protein